MVLEFDEVAMLPEDGDFAAAAKASFTKAGLD
jgi:hypothetical protein